MSEVFTVFYCWQSDTNQNHNRHLIREALDAAADRISNDSTVPFKIAVHSDTENEPGLCNIPETILRRLREADAVVSDLTFVARTSNEGVAKHCSNPNVLFELGYAFSEIGPERLICVMNEAHGVCANQVFDLAHHRRPIGYTSPNDACSRATSVEKLSKALEVALRGVLKLGLSGGNGGDDDIMHQRQLSEIEDYWNSVSMDRQDYPYLNLSFRPKLFRVKRWPDAEVLETKVMTLGVSTGRFQKYPPQPKGNAPMNWGLYNDTYGDPWTLSYSGLFWTCILIGNRGTRKLSDRDAMVSPERPASLQLEDGQWISMDHTLTSISTAFQFVSRLCSEYADSEHLRWSFEASNLSGKWLGLPSVNESRGPSKSKVIKREGEMLVSEFKVNWMDVFADFGKDLCDLFCRDGRTFSRDDIKQFGNPNA